MNKSLAIILTSLLATLPVPAQDSEVSASAVATSPQVAQVTTLEPVVITANRRVTPRHDLARTAYRIDNETLERRQVRTLPEALTEIPGVLVQKTSHGQGSPYIRGFTAMRNLVLIDGVRYNNSVLRSGPNEYWAFIDPLALGGIEVLPGSGAIPYGSDAIGGTLMARTKSAPWRLYGDGEWFTGGELYQRWHSSENSFVSRAEIQLGQGERWGLHVGGSFKQFGDIDSPVVGQQPYTGYDQWGYDMRLDVALGDDWQLTLLHHWFEQDDAWRTHSTVFGRSWLGTTVGSNRRRVFDHERSLSYARLQGQPDVAWLDDVSLTLSLQTLDEVQDRVRGSGRRTVTGFDLLTRGIDLQLESSTPVGTLTYGADYYRDRVRSFSTNIDSTGRLVTGGIQGPVGDGATYDLFGAYAMLDSPVTSRTTLELGGRYTYARADVDRIENPTGPGAIAFSDSYDDFSGSIRLLQDLTEDGDWRAFAGLAQSFRAPNLSDVSRLDIARSGELETAAFGLEPEKFLSAEVGLRKRSEKFDGQLVAYHTWIEDLIVRQPTGRIIDGATEVTKANASTGYVQGIELSLAWRPAPEWTLSTAVGWQQGEVDSFPGGPGTAAVREPLSRSAPLTGHASIRYDHSSGKWGAELAAQAVDRADRLSTRDRGDTQRIPPGGTPGYVNLSLRTYYRVNEFLELQANVENLLDEDYRYHGSGSNEPGIGVALGARLTF